MFDIGFIAFAVAIDFLEQLADTGVVLGITDAVVDAFETLINELLNDFISWLTGLFVGITEQLLIIKPPNTIAGAKDLKDNVTVPLFGGIATIFVINHGYTYMIFPDDDKTHIKRALLKTLAAAIVLWLMDDLFYHIINVTNKITREVAPATLTLQFEFQGVMDALGGGVGVFGLLISAGWLTATILTSTLLFWLSLAMRNVLLIALYALFPIFVAMQISDVGAGQYFNKVIDIAFSLFVAMLLVGPLVAGVLAVGDSVANANGVASVNQTSSGNNTVLPNVAAGQQSLGNVIGNATTGVGNNSTAVGGPTSMGGSSGGSAPPGSVAGTAAQSQSQSQSQSQLNRDQSAMFRVFVFAGSLILCTTVVSMAGLGSLTGGAGRAMRRGVRGGMRKMKGKIGSSSSASSSGAATGVGGIGGGGDIGSRPPGGGSGGRRKSPGESASSGTSGGDSSTPDNTNVAEQTQADDSGGSSSNTSGDSSSPVASGPIVGTGQGESVNSETTDTSDEETSTSWEALTSSTAGESAETTTDQGAETGQQTVTEEQSSNQQTTVSSTEDSSSTSENASESGSSVDAGTSETESIGSETSDDANDPQTVREEMDAQRRTRSMNKGTDEPVEGYDALKEDHPALTAEQSGSKWQRTKQMMKSGAKTAAPYARGAGEVILEPNPGKSAVLTGEKAVGKGKDVYRSGKAWKNKRAQQKARTSRMQAHMNHRLRNPDPDRPSAQDVSPDKWGIGPEGDGTDEEPEKIGGPDLSGSRSDGDSDTPDQDMFTNDSDEPVDSPESAETGDPSENDGESEQDDIGENQEEAEDDDDDEGLEVLFRDRSDENKD